jgi:hypothetical protein
LQAQAQHRQQIKRHQNANKSSNAPGTRGRQRQTYAALAAAMVPGRWHTTGLGRPQGGLESEHSRPPLQHGGRGSQKQRQRQLSQWRSPAAPQRGTCSQGSTSGGSGVNTSKAGTYASARGDAAPGCSSGRQGQRAWGLPS